jgi:DNA integrity scanning protein DisA with diadenylate cyclase activity
MLSKMNLISVVQQLPKEDIEIIQGYVEMIEKENEQLKEQLLVSQTNEETFRLETENITKTLGLDEDTIFDDVKIYARSLKDNWDKLKEIAKSQSGFKKRADLKGGLWFEVDELLDKMQELEQESDNK